MLVTVSQTISDDLSSDGRGERRKKQASGVTLNWQFVLSFLVRKIGSTGCAQFLSCRVRATGEEKERVPKERGEKQWVSAAAKAQSSLPLVEILQNHYRA